MPSKEVLTRFGVSMPQDLIEQFDKLISERGYDSRSEAIRDLVRKSLIDPNHLQSTNMVAGTIVIMYNHHFVGLTNYLLELQHDYHHEIISTMHVHINHHQCLEIIVVRGVLAKLRQMHQMIQVQKGVFYAELSVTYVDEQQTAQK
nr:nickel-responsive transcriptional regulator NikR [Desulforamulus aquiferis]